MLNKITIGVVLFLVSMASVRWLFNYVNPYLAFLLLGIILYFTINYINKQLIKSKDKHENN